MLFLPHLKNVEYFLLKLYEWCSKDIEEDKTFYLKPLSIIVLNVQIQASITPTGFKQLFMRLNFILFKTSLRNGHYRVGVIFIHFSTNLSCYHLLFPLLMKSQHSPTLLPKYDSLASISMLASNRLKTLSVKTLLNIPTFLCLLRKSQISHISESKSFIMV